MGQPLLDRARPGHYESFYIKACEPGGGRGIWIRHTVHKRPGAEPNGSIWFVFFDRAAEGPRATKVTVPASELSAPQGSWIQVGDAIVGPGAAEGSVETDALSAGWSLTFSAEAEPCKYLPADWLYEAPLPKTKFVAPVPLAHFEGRLEIDDEESIEFIGWPGMIGHNWGTEHAERWVWLEGTGFEDAPAPTSTPAPRGSSWGPGRRPGCPRGCSSSTASGTASAVSAKARRATIEDSPTACSFVLPGEDVVVRGRVSAPRKDFVGWVYADPKGPEHNTVNCSVADLELTVERPARPLRTLTLAAGAAYECGMRETDHGIPIQPYPDG